MAVPYTFGSATSSIPLSQLDSNFATAITLGTTNVYLGNTTTTLNGLTLSNVTISSGNVTITSVTITNANITGTTTLSGLTASTALALDASKNIVSVTNTGTGNNVLAASPSLTGTVTIATLNLTNALGTGYGGTGLTSFTSGGVLYASSSSALTSGSALTFDGTNLGVGTASPAVKLEVVSGAETIRLSRSTSGSVYLGFAQAGTRKAYLESNNADVNLFAEAASSNIIFGTVGTERARIDSSGNLGLGVTPSAWTTFKVMQLGNFGAIGGVNSTSMNMFANTFYDGAFKYINTSSASRYRMDDGHSWFTAPSGTAGNAITFTQAMTLSADGHLQVGTTSNLGGITVKAPNAGATGSQIGLSIIGRDTYNDSQIAFYAADASTVKQQIYSSNSGNDWNLSNASNGATIFATNGSERARIDSSGNFLINKTSTLGSAHQTIACTAGAGSKIPLALQVGVDTTGYTCVGFYNQSGQQGSITVNTSSVSYNTSSDYRLKNTIAPMTGALAKVALLKPCTYKWNADGSDGQGFIAHELAEVVPQCVTGEKDAVDEEGNPKYQGIDTSFLVATLTAAIQEQQAMIESLTARLDAANL